MKYGTMLLIAGIFSFGCKQNTGFQESDNFSGLLTLGVTSGTQMTKENALIEIGKFCSPAALPGYIDRISQKLSFNAGYSSHPNAGYDAGIVKRVGPDGKESYYIGSGQMFDGAGSLAMKPPTNGNISELIAGYCRVAMASLSGDASGCAYPMAEVSQGGSVSGSSARGSINSSSCIIAKLQNQQIRHRAEYAFCPDALGVNFFTSADGAAGEMSAIIRSGG